MPVFFAERALLSTGWARNVRLEVAADGRLSSLQADASAEGAERLAGPQRQVDAIDCLDVIDHAAH